MVKHFQKQSLESLRRALPKFINCIEVFNFIVMLGFGIVRSFFLINLD